MFFSGLGCVCVLTLRQLVRSQSVLEVLFISTNVISFVVRVLSRFSLCNYLINDTGWISNGSHFENDFKYGMNLQIHSIFKIFIRRIENVT